MLHLTDNDLSLLAGEHGPGSQMAMRIIVRMAEVFDAGELLDITAAHIDSTIFMGDATLEYAERLADLGATVAVPATSNVSGVDEHGWAEWPVPPAWAEKARRQMDAYRRMGVSASFTCAPYQTELRPAFGQQIAWGESNAIAFANTVLGARTERYPDLLDICAAITGRVPAVGLHLTENRAGQLLIRLVDVPPSLQADDSFYPVLGHLVGKLAGDRIPVIDGLDLRPTEDQLKALCAAAATSGAVALGHIVGVTPEAPNLEAAFQSRAPDETYLIGMSELRAARAELTTATGETPDLVLLGSPHFSLAEFRQLAPLLDGQARHPGVRFLVTTSRAVVALAEHAGLLAPLRRFGGQLTVDTCPLATPMLPPEIRTLMTNSAKYAYYAPGLLDTRVVYGSLADCVRSAVEGRVLRDETLWGAEDGDFTAEAAESAVSSHVLRVLCAPRGRIPIRTPGSRRVRRSKGPVAFQRRAAELLGRLRRGHRRNHRPAASALGPDRGRASAGDPVHQGLQHDDRRVPGSRARRHRARGDPHRRDRCVPGAGLDRG